MPGRSPTSASTLRLGVYTDYAYHRAAGGIYAERAFALFLAEVARRIDRMVVIGRLDPSSHGAHYRIGAEADFVALPHYSSLAELSVAGRAMAGSLRRYWRALDDLDAVWILGPHPLALPFALIAALRRRRVRLGVRQNFPAYIRERRGRNPLMRSAAFLLEGSFRLLARACPTVVVGPEIAHHYRRAHRRLEIAVSLVGRDHILSPPQAAQRDYEGELVALSVGRIDVEKNPLILADTLSLLLERNPRWKMVVCGEGPMEEKLAARFAELGLSGQAELLGYVPLDGGLQEIYRRSSVLFHASWTEGLPQVLFEAFAAGLPVVATDVGGIRAAVGGAARLVQAGDSAAAASELERVATDAGLRTRMVTAGIEIVSARTIEAEAQRVAEFLAQPTRSTAESSTPSLLEEPW